VSVTLIWALLVVAFAVAEGATVGLTSIWFALGALASMIASFFIKGIWTQIWIFLIVSLLTLLALRPIAARYFSKKDHQPTNADRIVGKEAVVLEEICNLENRGRIKVMGQEWAARSVGEENISKGAVVVIQSIEGVKVYVSPRP